MMRHLKTNCQNVVYHVTCISDSEQCPPNRILMSQLSEKGTGARFEVFTAVSTQDGVFGLCYSVVLWFHHVDGGSKVLGNVGVLRSVAIRKTSTCGGTRGMSILGFYFLLGSSHEQNGRLHMIGCKSLKVKDQMWRPVIALPLRIWEVPSLSLGLVVGSSDWDIAWCSSVPPH
jgi:hypothetical protein